MAVFVKRCDECGTFKKEKEIINGVCEECLNIRNLLNNPGLNRLATLTLKFQDKWWYDLETGEPLDRNHGELFMLMVTELSEGFEAIRKDAPDDHLPHRSGVEVEIADLLIRVLSYAAKYNIDLDGAYTEKMRYNETRADHQPEERRKPGGKKI